ncbi:GFA family protein [Pseudomonas sp. GD04058]|uniref:GFA family protein n=1 Tax=Pseudomonas sp. GD04058 TaxID=2975429 RepID=UPI00244A812F|nr:GFA family protein [Pseudomonas sp. GD04058]MDG9883498.1 GFA family protein [Pseudomonas sp. GD04058]
MSPITGGCLCGQVRFEARGEPYRVGLCHCMDCRKHHGALLNASAIYPETAVSVTGQTGTYQNRHFCPKCGSPVFSRSGDEVELNIGSLDAPSQFKPTYELWVIRRENWLPEFPGIKHFERDRTGTSRNED